MFRILIVEDSTLDELLLPVSEAFTEPDGEPGVTVHTAKALAEAEELIHAAERTGLPYHAVILDFKLPERVGLTPTKIDESLCLLIRRMRWPTLVAHITAWGEDEDVRRHLQLVHHERLDPMDLLFLKTDGRYASKLVRSLKEFLYGMRIEEQMLSVFGDTRELAFAARGRALRERARFERSMTHDIAALRRDIAAHWHDLDERLQAKISKFFRVDAESRPVRVSLRQTAAQT
jgi:CheY-like chemotaxis protein